MTCNRHGPNVSLAALLAFAALTLLPAAPAAAQTQPAAETKPLLWGGRSRPVDLSLDPTAVRSRSVEVDFDVLADLRTHRRIAFDLFDDVSFTGVVERMRGRGTWSGRLEGVPGGTFTMVARDTILAGVVRTAAAATYRIQWAGDGHVVQEINVAAYPPCAGAPEPALPAGGGVPGQINCVGASEIDVVVLYTTLAKDAAGGTEAIEAEIDLAVAVTNDAYDNSLIGTQLNLVHAAETSYGEGGDYASHLYSLTDPDDHSIDEAHGLRYQHAADMVAMLVTDTQYCGIAWLMPSNSPDSADTAFSVTTWTCAVGGLVFAHELGHNMGCCHAPGDGGGCTSGGLFPYSVGYRYYGDSGTQWRTVMAYAPGTRITNFSNPDVIHDGEPTGVPVDEPDPADNALTINLTAPTIANYRCSLPYCEASQTVASDNGDQDSFGSSLSVSGDTAVVGAYLDDDDQGAGSAYIFGLDSVTGQWVEQHKVLPSDGALLDLFGDAVGISGDAVVVGATRDDDNGEDSGSAYVFRYDPDLESWLEEAKLLASDGAAGDWLGAAASIRGDVAIVGAPQHDDNGSESGAAYVYRHDAGDWTEEAKLLASDGAAGDRFGTAVVVDGDLAIVGAPADGNGDEPGAVYVFRFDGTWQQEAVLSPSPGGQDAFGTSLSLDGDVLIVGASADNDNGDDSGAAYVYRHDGADWQMEGKLLASDGSFGDTFGGAVDVRGDRAIVGAFFDSANGIVSGSAYTYRYDGFGWTETAKLLAPGGQKFDVFGFAVASLGNQALVTAVSWNANMGAIYLFNGFSGADCNGNNLHDDCEVIFGEVTDVNGNLVPDECENSADLDGDGQVGINDFLLLLSLWGPCPDCPPACLGDLDGDCMVGINDFLELLANWG